VGHADDSGSQAIGHRQATLREVWPVFSPDGRWMAYQSNESGRPEIYVRAFVAPGETGAKATGGQWQVSTSGGIMPAWRSDGKELYYLDPTGVMMAAPITVTPSAIEPGAPVKLFPPESSEVVWTRSRARSTAWLRMAASSSTRNWTSPTRQSRC
jgi:WD40-like Beta Propeller Repeat